MSQHSTTAAHFCEVAVEQLRMRLDTPRREPTRNLEYIAMSIESTLQLPTPPMQSIAQYDEGVQHSQQDEQDEEVGAL